MKNFIFVLLCTLIVSIGTAQKTMTTAQWQEDLDHLQQTVHKDYPFLFKKTTKESFDKEITSLRANIPNLREHEIVVGMARIVASFKYGHTVFGLSHMESSVGQLPMSMYVFNDGIYVQGIHKDYEDALGARVVAISGKPIKEVLQAIYPVVPAENEQFFKAWGMRYLLSPEVLHAQKVIPELSNTVEFTLEKNGKTFKKNIKTVNKEEAPDIAYGYIQQKGNYLDARDQTDTPFYLKNLDKIYYFEHLPEQKTLYVRQSQIQDDPSENIPDFYTRVFEFINSNDVEKLVIDLRLNGGGNNYKNKAVITRIIENKRINQVGNLMVIIGRRTFSACQNLVNELDNYTNAVFVGEPTAENVNFYGDNNRVELPNSGYPVYLSFAWWQDKPQWEGAEWTAPHLAVDMSFDQYRTNQDPVLDAVLNFDGSDFVLDPMQYMTDLYQAGQAEKLGMDVAKMIRDPRYKFFDFEGELNNTGYRLLERGDHETAIAIFSFVSQLFPESANAWDSLAEGYLKAGDTAKATELYNKALSMDPNGPTGRNASEMLRKIKAGVDH